MAALFMENTDISAERTAADVSYMLSQSGASKIMQEFNADREVSGLSFALRVGDHELCYSLPVRTEPIFKIINGRRPLATREKKQGTDNIQAVRVAWRQLYRWIQAQLAMIETGMVKTEEVFLPYMILPGRGKQRTIYDALSSTGFQKALPNLKDGE